MRPLQQQTLFERAARLFSEKDFLPETAAPLLPSEPEAASAAAPVLTTYAVQCYVTVRVVLTEVVAADPRSAAEIARDRFCANEQPPEAEYVAELSTFLVQVVGEGDPSKTALFQTEWTPIPADDADAAERRPG